MARIPERMCTELEIKHEPTPAELATLTDLAAAIVVAMNAVEAGPGPSFCLISKQASTLVTAASNTLMPEAVPPRADKIVPTAWHQLRYMLNPFFIASVWPLLRRCNDELPAHCSQRLLDGGVRHLRHWVFVAAFHKFGVDRSFYQTAARPVAKEPLSPMLGKVFGQLAGDRRRRFMAERDFHKWRLS